MTLNREEQLQRAVVQRIAVSLPYPPSLNNLYGNRQKGAEGPGRYKVPRYASWCRVAETEIMRQRVRWDVRLISGKVAVRIFAERRDDGRRHDLDNLHKPILDCIKNMRLIDDDSEIEDLHIARADGIEGVYVEITPYALSTLGTKRGRGAV